MHHGRRRTRPAAASEGGARRAQALAASEGDGPGAACLKGGFIGIGADYEPARRVGSWGCRSGSFREALTDRCWRCPRDYSYADSKAVDDPRACYWNPR